MLSDKSAPLWEVAGLGEVACTLHQPAESPGDWGKPRLSSAATGGSGRQGEGGRNGAERGEGGRAHGQTGLGREQRQDPHLARILSPVPGLVGPNPAHLVQQQ